METKNPRIWWECLFRYADPYNCRKYWDCDANLGGYYSYLINLIDNIFGKLFMMKGLEQKLLRYSNIFFLGFFLHVCFFSSYSLKKAKNLKMGFKISLKK